MSDQGDAFAAATFDTVLAYPKAVRAGQFVHRPVASGAGGSLSTSQQLGGALGIAIVGTVFFDRLERHSFTAAFKHATPVVIALVLAAALSLAPPCTAVGEEEVAEI